MVHSRADQSPLIPLEAAALADLPLDLGRLLCQAFRSLQAMMLSSVPYQPAAPHTPCQRPPVAANAGECGERDHCRHRRIGPAPLLPRGSRFIPVELPVLPSSLALLNAPVNSFPWPLDSPDSFTADVASSAIPMTKPTPAASESGCYRRS